MPAHHQYRVDVNSTPVLPPQRRAPSTIDEVDSRHSVPFDVMLPTIVVGVGSLVVALSGVRGADYPAHQLRAVLWERAGASVWNNYWYGGHATPSYSVIVPPMVAAIGAVAVCTVSSIIATYCFARLINSVAESRSTMLGGVVFALAALVNVVVGRTAFAVGLAFALAAMWAWRQGRSVRALVLATLTPLASPVAATFVALAAGALCCDAIWPGVGNRRDLRGRLSNVAFPFAMGVASAGPILVMGALFGSEGRFPFRGDLFVFSVIVMVVSAALAIHRVVRIALVLALVSSVIIFVVPNPLGGNFLRLTQYIVVPVAIVGVALANRKLVPVAALLLAGATGWSLQYGVVSAIEWSGDDSTDVSFHQPLIDEVVKRNADGRSMGRLEIPFTENHWESLFVAPEVPFARGWERQTDLERNAELYSDLDAEAYHAWLSKNAVRWIALPDVPLDHGGRPESELLARSYEIEWLDLVWWNDDWRLYEVIDFVPIVDRPAMLESQSPDEIVLSTKAPATVTVRYEYSEDMSISGGACLLPRDDGYMTAHLPSAGTYTLRVDPEAALLGVDPVGCEASIGDVSGSARP